MLPNELLSKQANDNPNRIAVVDKGLSYTYQELFQQATRLAKLLREEVKLSSSPIALLFEPSIEGIISAYACLALGLVFVPISPQETIDNIVRILDQVHPDILLTLNQDSEKLSLPNTTVIAVDTVPLNYDKKTDQLTQSEVLTQSDLAAIIFTSGSSGKPKGVLIPKAGWEQMVNTWESELRISQYDQFLVMSGFNFCGFFDDMFMCFFVGGTMHICDESTKKNIRKLVTYIQNNKINFIDFTPAYARQIGRYLERHAQEELPDDSLLVVGSESWFVGEMQRVKQVLPKTKVISSYGLTESVVDSGIFDADEIETAGLSPDELVPVGRPFGNTEFVVLDGDQQPVGVGEEGELCVASDGLALGYLDPSIAGNFDFYQDERIVRTGDLVTQDENGLVRLSGRKDQVVKIHGKRVDLKKVEQVLFDTIGVNDVAVLHLNEAGNSSLVCFLRLANSHDAAMAEPQIVTKILQITQVESLPLQIIFLPEIPRKSDGKISFAALRNLLNQAQNESKEINNHTNVMYQIFQSYFGDKFDENTDIFFLGADSLMIEEIAIDIEEKTNIKIATETFYRERTVKKIVASLEYNGTVVEDGLSQVMVLDKDIRLPAEIAKPERLLSQEVNLQDMSPVLLTGASGFLGVHLLQELLDKSAEVYCLLRGRNDRVALQKIVNTWSKFISSPCPTDRIKIVLGDFTKPDLGLNTEQYDWLTQNTKSVVHAGYWVNFLLDYYTLQGPNVQGLDNLLTFAAEANIKPVSFISSSSASFIDPADQLAEHDGYELTKYVNEGKMRLFGELGYPYTIFAPALITPSSDRPHFPQNDFFWSFIQSSIAVGTLPDIDWSVDLVPANELSKVIVANLNAFGQKTVITNKEPLTIEKLKEATQRVLGIPMHLSSFDSWLSLLKNQSQTGGELPISPFFSGLEQKGANFFDSGIKKLPDNVNVAYVEQSSFQLIETYLSATK